MCFFTALMFYNMLQLKEDFSYRIFFEKDNVNLLNLEQFENEFNGSDTLVVAIYSPSGIFDTESVTLLADLSDKLWQTPHSVRVDSLINFQFISAEESNLTVQNFIDLDQSLTQAYLDSRKKIVKTHKFLSNYLINKDFDTTLVNINLRPDSDLVEFDQAVNYVRELLTQIDQGDHQFYLNGSAALTYSFKEGSILDMQKLFPIVIALALILLWVCTRTIFGVVVSFFMLMFVSISAYGLISVFNITIHNLTIFVAQILIGISIADVAHILVSYRSYLKKYANSVDALYFAAEKNFTPTLLTSVTTAVGFYSFMFSELPALKEFGFMAGSGTVLAWVYTYFFAIPAFKLFPLKTTVNQDIKKFKPSLFSLNFIRLLLKYKILIYSFFFVLGVYCVFLVTKININSDPIGYFDDNVPIAQSSNFMVEKFGGPLSLDIIVDSNEVDGIYDADFLRRADILQHWVKDLDGITSVTSLLDVIKDLNKYLHDGDEAYYTIPNDDNVVAQELLLYTFSLPPGLDINNQITNKQDKLRLTAMVDLRDSKDWIKLMENIEQKASELHLSVVMTGRPSMFQRLVDPLTRSIIFSLFFAVLAISLIIILVLRSIKMGFISLIPNALPIVLGGSLFPLLGENMDYGSVLVASICLGIAVDDTVHIVVNYQRYLKEGKSPLDSMASVLTYTIPALFVTTLTLVVTFGSLMFGSFVPNQNLGKYTAIILSLALFIDLTLLPLLLITFNKGKTRIATKSS